MVYSSSFMARFGLLAVLPIIVATQPSRTHFYGSVSDTTVSKMSGVFRVVAEDSCACRLVFLPCQVELRPTAKSEASECPLLTRYCCQRATLITIPSLVEGLSKNGTKTTTEASPLTSSSVISESLTTLRDSEVDEATVSDNGEITETPSDGCLVRADCFDESGDNNATVLTTTIIDGSDEPEFITSITTSPSEVTTGDIFSVKTYITTTPSTATTSGRPSNGTTFKVDTSNATTTPPVTSKKTSLKPNSIQVGDEITEMKACSCMTQDECKSRWSVFQNLPKYKIKTSLKCKGEDEIICCFGNVIPPRRHKSNVAAVNRGASKTPSLSSSTSAEQDIAFWNTLENLMAWFNSE